MTAMSEIHTHLHDASRRSTDPTGTGSLRKLWFNVADLRLRQLRAQMRIAVIDKDVLALAQSRDYMSSHQRLINFCQWFEEQATRVLEGSWVEPYVHQAYQMGHARATDETKEFTPFARDASMIQVVAAQQEMRGISASTSQGVQRAAADAAVRRVSPAVAFQNMVVEIDRARPRLKTMVNTVVVTAYIRAKTQAYRRAGIFQVGVDPERLLTSTPRVGDAAIEDVKKKVKAKKRGRRGYRRSTAPGTSAFQETFGVHTAGDFKVCLKCEEIADGSPYSVDEIDELLPAHPNCRCAPYPWFDRRFRRDAAPARTLYVRRDLLNQDEVTAWARDQGIRDLLTDMHVTLLYSRSPVRGAEPLMGNVSASGGRRTIEQLGKGALTLRFECHELSMRHLALRAMGASHDYPEYAPHVTLTYGTVDAGFRPYEGALRFGPEVFEDVKP